MATDDPIDGLLDESELSRLLSLAVEGTELAKSVQLMNGVAEARDMVRFGDAESKPVLFRLSISTDVYRVRADPEDPRGSVAHGLRTCILDAAERAHRENGQPMVVGLHRRARRENGAVTFRLGPGQLCEPVELSPSVTTWRPVTLPDHPDPDPAPSGGSDG